MKVIPNANVNTGCAHCRSLKRCPRLLQLRVQDKRGTVYFSGCEAGLGCHRR